METVTISIEEYILLLVCKKSNLLDDLSSFNYRNSSAGKQTQKEIDEIEEKLKRLKSKNN